MPRRSILSAAERESLLALPDARDDLIRYYTFSDTDLSIIRQHRGAANRLGFAMQLCYLRFPGILLGVDQPPFPPLLRLVADQLRVPAESWNDYGQREQIRREHLVELQTWLGMTMFSAADYRRLVHQLAELAQQTDRGIVLAEALVELLRQQRIIQPAIDVIERVCSEALTRGTRQVYEALTASLADYHRRALDGLLAIREGTKGSGLIWLRQPPGPPKPKLVNAQFHQPFAAYWGDGTTSSSDGQNFKAGGRGHAAGQVNLKYGQEPGVQFYTHISDQYAPFHTKVINATVRDATHVLDGLLYHESDLRIEEHYTDTAGFTDHVFALMHLLGFRFAPRIRDLADKRLYIHGDAKQYPTLAGLIGGSVNVKHIRAHWDEILRLAASIKQGTVTASLMLRKLGSYPRQSGLAVALRELGRIERTLFALDWMQNVELRRRAQIGLNKGEAKNALARAVFLNRLGEIRDRSFENQRYRASGLNPVVVAIILWNTVNLERAIQVLRDAGKDIDEKLLPHLSPLGWEHINLTGDYIWRQNKHVEQGKFRPLRVLGEA